MTLRPILRPACLYLFRRHRWQITNGTATDTDSLSWLVARRSPKKSLESRLRAMHYQGESAVCMRCGERPPEGTSEPPECLETEGVGEKPITTWMRAGETYDQLFARHALAVKAR